MLFVGADRSKPDVRLPALGADAEGSRRLGGNDTLTQRCLTGAVH